jgi:hypothetical protein
MRIPKLLFFLFVTVCLGAAAPADATEEGRVAIVAPNEAADFARAAAIAEDARGREVVSAGEVAATLAKPGLGEAADRATGALPARAMRSRDIRALAKALALVAVITIALAPGEETQLTAQLTEWNARGRPVRRWAWSRAREQASPPMPAPAPTPAGLDLPTPPASALPAVPVPRPVLSPPFPPAPAAAVQGRPAKERSHTDRVEPLELSAGGRLLFRELTYEGDRDALLSDLRSAVPTLGMGLQARINPLPGSLQPLGLVLAAEVGQPFRTVTDAGLFLSNASDLSAAIAWSIIESRFRAGIDLGFGRQAFTYRLEGARITHPQPVPDVSYHYLRGGIDGELHLIGPFAVRAGVHYRHVLTSGGLTSANWFPGARVTGFDWGLGAVYRFDARWAVAVAYDVRRYHQDFSAARSVRAADGAFDVYHGLALVLGFRWGRAS